MCIMEDTIVLYPSPGIGHLISMVELAKLVLTHNPTFSINVLILKPPLISAGAGDDISQQIATSTAEYIAAVSATNPSIAFHHLTPISLPPSSDISPIELNFELPRLSNPNIQQLLLKLSETSKVKAFVLDFFCDAAFQVSTNLNIPTYYFFTSTGSGLALFLYFPTLHNIEPHQKNMKDLGFPILTPGLPPIPVLDIPSVIHDRTSGVYRRFLDTATHLAESSGIIVNTFKSLESKALKAISDGLCVPERETPPIFCVGPVISTTIGNSSNGDNEHECLRWLKKQPNKSVVFLCFGSMGLFPAKQLAEMAVALEKSGLRFLWVVRDPPLDPDDDGGGAENSRSLEAILPEGFLERTKERGLVVRKWAPQVAVLNHDSVGGFVTHCGWNSLLEAVCAGVPMVAWPLYAEQRMNRVVLVEEMKLGLAVNESEDGLVCAAELEERLRELMDSERGREVRERVMIMKKAAESALECGGSSYIALTKLTEQWKQN